MKKMKKSFAAMAAVLAVFVFSMAAEAGTIMIKNNTGFDIYEIYVSSSGTDQWEEDIMGRDVLENGESVRLTVNGTYSKFDMRAVDDDGNTVDWYEFPGKTKQITIFGDGTCQYQ